MLHVGFKESNVEGQRDLPTPACHAAFSMRARILLAFWATSAHCWLLHNFSSANIPKPFFALNPLIPQSVLLLGIAPTQVLDLTLGFVELREVHMGSLLKPVHMSLDGVPSLSRINSTTQLGFVP